MFTLHNTRRLLSIDTPAEPGGGGGAPGTDPAPESGAPAGGESTDEGGKGDDGDGDGFDAAKALAKIKRINSENANLRAAKKAAEEKAAKAEADSARVTALEAENLRWRTGTKLGLPADLIDRLRGDTEEEITADAESLLKFVAGRVPPSNQPRERIGTPAGGDPAPKVESLDDIAERMFRR